MLLEPSRWQSAVVVGSVLLLWLVLSYRSPRLGFLSEPEDRFDLLGRSLFGASEGNEDVVKQDGATYLINGLEPNPISSILPSDPTDEKPPTVTEPLDEKPEEQIAKSTSCPPCPPCVKPACAPVVSAQHTMHTEGSEHSEGSEKLDVAAENLALNQERVTAGMTLGSVAFQMSLFYLVNHRDSDLRRYSYGVIGETISIFCSVLLFNAIYAFVEDQLHDSNLLFECLIFLGCFSSFFIVMEVAVMIASRIRGASAHKRSAVHRTKLKIYAHVLNAKTFGSCAAQMCGAATIRGFGHLQFMALRRAHSFVLLVLVVPLAFTVLVGLMWFFSWVRAKIILRDEHMDATELTWVEVAEECENEVCALCLGFNLAVVVRFIITGTLPHMLSQGFEHVSHEHGHEINMRSMSFLMAAGLSCAFLSVIVTVLNFGHMTSPVDKETLRTSFKIRNLRLVIKSCTMCFAWCTCFALHIMVSHICGGIEGVRFRLFLAVFQSVVAFIMILIMDFISDLDCTGAAYDRGIVNLIEALGVSVGLSWEHAFHECVSISVEFMSEDKNIFRATDNPKIWSFLLSGVIVLTVLPAYRLYIVPTRYLLIEEYEKTQEEAEEDYRSAQGSPTHSPRQNGKEEKTYIFDADDDRVTPRVKFVKEKRKQLDARTF